jgi:hypothetical protein
MKFTLDANLILPRLWLGDFSSCGEAQRRGFKTLCVYDCRCDHKNCHWQPIMKEWCRADLFLVWKAVEKLSELYDSGDTVLIHCAAGVERSPLVTALWMARKFGISLDEAYAWLKDRRPVVENRQVWLRDEPPRTSAYDFKDDF